MISQEELKTGLDMAAETNKPVNYQNKFLVAPQLPQGKSAWANWVRDGFLRPEDVVWAFINEEPKKWLAVRVQINKRVFYFNLQNPKDRTNLKKLEDKYRAIASL